MNVKILTGIALAIAATSFFLMRPAAAPPSTTNTVPEHATTTAITPATKPAPNRAPQPTFLIGTSSVTTTPAVAEFDSLSFSSTSTYPVVSGTANSTKVGIVINNSKNVGVIGTWEIPVMNGHWSYSSSVALEPGSYTLLLFVGAKSASTAKLLVTK